jgi:L-iditol 2-dehydrogenase
MKAVLYSDWGKLEIADVEQPHPAEDEVVLRVAACGICGSELDGVRSRSPRRPPPLVMGHEFCGYVHEVGASVQGWKVGQSAISHGVVHCGSCIPCRQGHTNLCIQRQVFGMHRPGAFAEYVSVPARALLRWPEKLTAQTASFAEPLANGINILKLDPTQSRERVLVIGAGPIGLMCICAARAIYKSKVISVDLIPERLEVAGRLGAEITLNAATEDVFSKIKEAWGMAPDIVIDAVGSGATKARSLKLAKAGGTIVWTGLHDNTISVDSFEITLQQRRVLGSYSGDMEDAAQAVDLLSSGELDMDSWTKSFPLEKGDVAFERMLAAKGDDIKAVIHMI